MAKSGREPSESFTWCGRVSSHEMYATCFVLFFVTEETAVMVEIPDSDQIIAIARAHGWHVLARDSEIQQPPEIEPAQSNPFRKD